MSAAHERPPESCRGPCGPGQTQIAKPHPLASDQLVWVGSKRCVSSKFPAVVDTAGWVDFENRL